VNSPQIRVWFVSVPALSANYWSNLAYLAMLAGLILSVWRIRAGWWFELLVVESVMACWGLATGQDGLVAGAVTWAAYYMVMLVRYRARGGRQPGHCGCCRHNSPPEPESQPQTGGPTSRRNGHPDSGRPEPYLVRS
jgi:hypothetical protein